MNKNFFIAVAVVLIFLVGVYFYRQSTIRPTTSDQRTVAENISPTQVQKTIAGVYAGRLPCADCEGIDAVLTLYSDETYTMTNTYIGKDVTPYEETGKWTTLRGDAENPDAVVYQLYNPDDSSAVDQNYLVDGDTLVQLDQDMKPINTPFTTTLTKKALE